MVSADMFTGFVPALSVPFASSHSVPEVNLVELSFSMAGMFCLFIAATVLGAIALARWPERRRLQRTRHAEITEQVFARRARTHRLLPEYLSPTSGTPAGPNSSVLTNRD